MTDRIDIEDSLAEEVDRLRAEVARLAAERDALLRWGTRHVGLLYPCPRPGAGDYYADGAGGRVTADTDTAAVRRAAGLDGPAPGGDAR